MSMTRNDWREVDGIQRTANAHLARALNMTADNALGARTRYTKSDIREALHATRERINNALQALME